MRILLLTQLVPYPPDSGPKIKTYHVLRYLFERGHQVTLVTFARADERKQLESIRQYCQEIHEVSLCRSRGADINAFVRTLPSHGSFLIARDANSQMSRTILRLSRTQVFDIIHADQLTMVQYALNARQSHLRGPQSPALVFDAHNAVWAIVERMQLTAPPFLRPILALEARRVKAYEGRICREMSAVLAVSEVDKRALVEAGADPAKISVIPIAIDSSNMKALNLDNKPANILSASTLFYPPNADGVRWFIHNVYPLVRESIPELTLTIVGPRPPQDIMQFALRNPRSATVTGYVHDLQPYLDRATVIVVPVRAGSGMRVRILEALARGIPVVTTAIGVEGIAAIHGEHMMIADEPQEFADAVTRLLRDAALRRQLAENGRRLVQDNYDWRVVLPKLDQVYARAMRN